MAKKESYLKAFERIAEELVAKGWKLSDYFLTDGNSIIRYKSRQPAELTTVGKMRIREKIDLRGISADEIFNPRTADVDLPNKEFECDRCGVELGDSGDCS